MRSVLGRTNFINGFLLGVDYSKSARNEEPSSRGAVNSGLASGDSGLQVNLEIALSGVSAKVKPPTGFSAGRKCVETPDDVIKSLYMIRGVVSSPFFLFSVHQRKGHYFHICCGQGIASQRE